MKPIEFPALDPKQIAALEDLYRSTRNVRLRTRALMVLLAAEQRLTAAEIAEIVRGSEETVRRWLKRYLAEGVEGLRGFCRFLAKVGVSDTAGRTPT